MLNTQVAYRKQGAAHMFIGADRLSHGVMVADTDLLKAFDEASRQLKLQLEQEHQITGTPECTIERDKLEETLAMFQTVFLLFKIDNFK